MYAISYIANNATDIATMTYKNSWTKRIQVDLIE